jgi:hypothetical protein
MHTHHVEETGAMLRGWIGDLGMATILHGT